MSDPIHPIPLFFPEHFRDYQLIDSGNQEKLERFGNITLCRPEPQAIWKKELKEGEWTKLSDAVFRRSREAKQGSFEGERGEWNLRNGIPQQWNIRYEGKETTFGLRLGFTSFGHIGVFPEQAPNWEYIASSVKNMLGQGPVKILNLFAYTGASTLAAAAAGAEVWHVDSVKPVITWARENAQMGGWNRIHWVVEDALKFVQREARRGNTYQGIVLDPPAYGRGPEGEKWILEDQLASMMETCFALLDKQKESFILLNLYSLGHSSLIARNMLNSGHIQWNKLENGELVIQEHTGRLLPLGVYARAGR